MTLSGVLGTLATALSIVFIWPQVFRVYAKRSVEGVSAMSQLQSLFASSLWFAYGNSLDRWPQIIASINIGTANLAILLLQWRFRVIRGYVLWPIFGISIVVSVVLPRISLEVLGFTAMVTVGYSIIPQTWRVWRSEHLYGVSVSTHFLLAAMGSAWLGYGILVRDVYTAGPNIIGVPCATYITWRAWRSHERFRTPETVAAQPTGHPDE